jgi:hypothetical protein
VLRSAAAADILYATLSPELHLSLVRDRGWSYARWARWAEATLVCSLGAG